MRDKILYILILGLVVAGVRFYFLAKPNPILFEQNLGTKVKFTGVLVDEPSFHTNNQKLTVQVVLANQKFKVLVSVPLDESFQYGDAVTVLGKLEKVENFITDQGKEFDYINYLRKDNILYLVDYAKVEKVSTGHGSVIKQKLFSFKAYFLDKINRVLPAPESTLLGGLILGERTQFDDAYKQAFIKTGTIHIIALSGYNVTIVAEWIIKLTAFLGRTFSFSFGIVGIIFFVIMTGAPSTAVRAGIMAVFALIARQTGRTYEAGRGLILAALVMIIFNPMILFYDISFQLSFLATIAVIYLTPKVEKYFTWMTNRFGLREIITVTTSAYIFVLPFILYKMGNLSLVALPTNVIILPLIPLTMFFGFLTGFFGLIYYIFSVPFGYIVYWLLHFELKVINFMSQLPFASFTIPNFPLWLTLLFYLYFFYQIFGTKIRSFFQQEKEFNW